MAVLAVECFHLFQGLSQRIHTEESTTYKQTNQRLLIIIVDGELEISFAFQVFHKITQVKFQ